jgi:thymidylate synthase ThyX
MDPTAQEEIRVYADKIWDIVKIWVPATAKAFENHHLLSKTFSGEELEVLTTLLKKVPDVGKWIQESKLKKRHKDKLLDLLK